MITRKKVWRSIRSWGQGVRGGAWQTLRRLRRPILIRVAWVLTALATGAVIALIVLPWQVDRWIQQDLKAPGAVESYRSPRISVPQPDIPAVERPQPQAPRQPTPDTEAEPSLERARLTPDLSTMTWPAAGSISTRYGWYRHPQFKDWRFHAGISIQPREGTEARAALGGVVDRIVQDTERGLTVVLRHGTGWETVYGNLAQVEVAEGQRVSSGARLGQLYRTASGSVSQLYFALRQGEKYRNPANYLP